MTLMAVFWFSRGQFIQPQRIRITHRLVAWSRMPFRPVNDLVKLATLVCRAEILAGSLSLHPVKRHDADIGLAHQDLSQHVDAVIHVQSYGRCLVSEFDRFVLWSVVIVAPCVHADHVLCSLEVVLFEPVQHLRDSEAGGQLQAMPYIGLRAPQSTSPLRERHPGGQ